MHFINLVPNRAETDVGVIRIFVLSEYSCYLDIHVIRIFMLSAYPDNNSLSG